MANGKRKGTIALWTVTVIVVLAAALLIWKFVIGSEDEAYEAPGTPVRTVEAYRADVERSFTLNGYVEAQAMIPVVPFVQGTLIEYLVDAGDYVEEGQLMAVVDPEPYALQAKQAEAVYLAAESTFERISNLYESGAATRQNYDEVKAQYDAYKAQYDLANLQLSYSNITAPASGTVLISDGAVGSIAVNTTYLFVIADLTKLKVTLNVPEKYYDTVSANQDNIVAYVTRNGSTCRATVGSVAPYISATSKTFEVTLELEFDGSEGEATLESFKPGMFVSVRLVYETVEDALVLPLDVVNTDGSLYSYDEATQTAVYHQLSLDVNDGEVFVIDDSYEGTLFIGEGRNGVLDGQRVNVI